MPWLGAVAAAELGIALDRLALVPYAGREWAATVAALLDGVDVVAVAVPPRMRQGDARRLAARARERGAVLLAVGDGWPVVDVRVRAGPSRWVGLGNGHGHLASRYVPIVVEGRGAAARPRHGRLWLPALDDDVRIAPARAPDPAARNPAPRHVTAHGNAAGVADVAGVGDLRRPVTPISA